MTKKKSAASSIVEAEAEVSRSSIVDTKPTSFAMKRSGAAWRDTAEASRASGFAAKPSSVAGVSMKKSCAASLVKADTSRASSFAAKTISVAVAPAYASSGATKTSSVAVAQIGPLTATQAPDDAPPPAASDLSVAVSTFADVEFGLLNPVEPQEVKVLAVHQLKHAPALLHLLKSASNRGCKILGLDLVEKLSKLDALLTIVSDGVIPLLLKDLQDPDANRELRRCARTIHRLGLPVRGCALRKTKALELVLRRHVSHVFNRTRRDNWLMKNLQVAIPSLIYTIRTHSIGLTRAPAPS